jgi:hypothetical protein
MKKILILLLFCQIGLAQKLSKINLLNQMSDEICTEMKTKKIDKSNFELTLGLVMMKSINNNKQNVEKFYGKKMYGENGILEKIGEDLGETMISRCPDMFERLNDIGALDKYVEEAETETIADTTGVSHEDEEPSIKGDFLSSKMESFQTIQIKENNGDVSNYILLYNFENSNLIIQNKLNMNDKVQIKYYDDIIYDSKQNKFVEFKVLTDIQKI